MMAGLPQPRTGAWLSAYRTSARPPPASTKPGIYSRPAAGSRCSAKNSNPMISTAVPNGTLMKKHHRQERKVVSTPPSTGPTAGPRLRPSSTMPTARARRSGGKVRNSMACPTGMIERHGALDDPEDDQLGQRTRQAAQRGGPGEQHQSSQVGAPGAEPVADPPRRRNHHGQGQQVAQRHPLRGGRGLMEVPGHRRQRRVDDRVVHRAHVEPDRVGHQDHQLLARPPPDHVTSHGPVLPASTGRHGPELQRRRRGLRRQSGGLTSESLHHAHSGPASSSSQSRTGRNRGVQASSQGTRIVRAAERGKQDRGPDFTAAFNVVLASAGIPDRALQFPDAVHERQRRIPDRRMPPRAPRPNPHLEPGPSAADPAETVRCDPFMLAASPPSA